MNELSPLTLGFAVEATLLGWLFLNALGFKKLFGQKCFRFFLSQQSDFLTCTFMLQNHKSVWFQ